MSTEREQNRSKKIGGDFPQGISVRALWHVLFEIRRIEVGDSANTPVKKPPTKIINLSRERIRRSK